MRLGHLGYATTAHRAQGLTVDTAHVLIHPGMTREALYVAMTRGRTANHAYVSTETPDAACALPADGAPTPSPREVLTTILATAGTSESATQAIDAEADHVSSLRRLSPIRDTLLADSDTRRAATLLPAAGLTPNQAASVLASPAVGPLLADLRRVGLDDDRSAALLRHLIDDRPLPTGDGDVAAVLHHRLAAWTDEHRALQDSPPSRGARSAESRLALVEDRARPTTDLEGTIARLDELITQRVRSIGAAAIERRPAWLPPAASTETAAVDDIATVAAYLDLHGETGASPRERTVPDREHRRQRAQALNAYQRLRTADTSSNPDQRRSAHR